MSKARNQSQLGRILCPIVFLLLALGSYGQTKRYTFAISATPNISWASAEYKNSSYKMRPGPGIGLGITIIRNLNTEYYCGANIEYLLKNYNMVALENANKSIYSATNLHPTFQLFVGKKLSFKNIGTLRFEIGGSINTYPITAFFQYSSPSANVNIAVLGKTAKCIIAKLGYTSKNKPRFTFYATINQGITQTETTEVFDTKTLQKIQRLIYRDSFFGVNILYRIR